MPLNYLHNLQILTNAFEENLFVTSMKTAAIQLVHTIVSVKKASAEMATSAKVTINLIFVHIHKFIHEYMNIYANREGEK